ncbi:hypothetical protein K2P97_05095 [bacterium]|nr:hypothetical protein [bacterium]
MTSYLRAEKYFKLNKYNSEQYFGSQCSTRLYQNFEMAIYDITASQLQFMSHKNYIGVVKNGCSLLETLNKNWQRQSLNIQLKNKSQQWFEFIETLNTDTNFVVWSSENEITGEVILDENLSYEIHERLSKKRIFSIQVTHTFNAEKLKALPTHAVLIIRNNIFYDGPVLVISTDKYKASSLIGEYQNLSAELNLHNYLQSAKQVKAVNADNVKNSYFSKFANPCFRLNDRIVLLFDEINASAIKEDLQLPDQYYFCTSEIPFWVLDLFKNWWEDAENENLLRGLMVISHDAINKDPAILDKINDSALKIRRLGQLDVL